jgi:hypothetical protein
MTYVHMVPADGGIVGFAFSDAPELDGWNENTGVRLTL